MKADLTIYDERGRPLVIFRRKPGKSSVVFARYEDMTEGDKKASKIVFDTIKGKDADATDEHGKGIGDIADFLGFKSNNELCG